MALDYKTNQPFEDNKNAAVEAEKTKGELAEGLIPGQRISLEFGRYTLEGRIEEMTEEGMVVTVQGDQSVFLNYHGESIPVKLWQEKFIYHFETSLVTNANGKEGFILKYPRLLSKVERRAFFRWKAWGDFHVYMAPDNACGVPVWLRYGKKDATEAPPGYKRLSVVDLSAGGLAIIHGPELKAKNRLHLMLPLESSPIYVYAAIVRARPEGDQFIYSLKFQGMQRADRDRIVAFVFRKQLALKNQERISTEKKTQGKDESARFDLRVLNKELVVEYRIDKTRFDVDHNFKKGKARDLGIGGISFYARDAIPQGSDMSLRFTLDRGVTVNVLAKVKRCIKTKEGMMVAAEFLAIDRASRKAIFYYLMKRKGGAD